MVAFAVWLSTFAVAAGSILALWHLRTPEGASRPPLAAGIAHGLVGAASLVALLLALLGPPRGVEAGAGSFGTVSAVLFAVAVPTGALIPVLRRNGLVIGAHAAIAITGYVVLLAWSALG